MPGERAQDWAGAAVEGWGPKNSTGVSQSEWGWGMQGDQEGETGRLEGWGRVPKDWEMGGIQTEVGRGPGGGAGQCSGAGAGRAGWRGLREAPRAGRRRGRRPGFPSPPRAHEIFHSPPGPWPVPGGPHKAALC